MKHVATLFGNVLYAWLLCFFVAVKLAGTSFATWSWWWFLAPLVPELSLVVRHYNL